MNKLYTRNTPACSWCIKTKELLKSQNIEFQEIVIGTDITRDEFIKFMYETLPDLPVTVPQFFMNNSYIGGYEKTKAYIDSVKQYA